MSNRLLILSASIGAGHVKAAEALYETYTGKFGGEARHLDFLHYTNPGLSRKIEQAYYLMTKHTPSVWKFLYNIGSLPNVPLKKLEVYLGFRKYSELLQEYKPDAIISTHFLPAAIVSYLYPQYPIPNSVVLTDYVSHQLWINSHTQLFFIAHPGMKEELITMGVEEHRIRITGIPCRPCFHQVIKSPALRSKLRIDRNLPLIMVMSGGNAIGPLTEILEELEPLKTKLQVIVITGRNRKSYREIKQVLYNTNLKGQIRGRVKNIHEWMAASAILISKAGGLTVTEALTLGLPMIIVRPTPGHEDGNTEFVINAGAGVYLKDIKELKPTIADLIHNPNKLATMNQSALKSSRPDANEKILMEMEQLIMRNKAPTIFKIPPERPIQSVPK
jgi:processive 1,2-diacylglycerol beta-glucosyltransferase